MSQTEQQRLVHALETLGLNDIIGKIPVILAYLEQLQRWNRAYNLTAIRDPGQMLVQHVFDSLSVVPEIRERASGRALTIADMGSGAGLPGIMLGICHPEWRIVCVDAVGKKTAFIRQVAGILSLDNVQAVHGRIEALESLQADIVISRAFASLQDFVQVASHHCTESGIMLAMKGQNPEEERQALEAHTDWTVKKIQALHVPELDAQRCLLELGIKDTHE